MEILYKVHNGLYANLTNKCPCACTFCLRQTTDHVGESGRLWLEREPSLEEVIAEFDKFDMDQFEEFVFCGFGEPTEALPVLLPVADYVKKTFGKKIRINTNGMGNLIWQRDITPEFEGRIDTVSISLNTPDAKRYQELVKSKFGDGSFDAMLDFAKRCTEHVSQVILSTVDTTITHEEEARCRQICEEIGVTYRIRPWEG
ncbi:MAG: TIGR04100 family radical SAM protein [Lachnospiraceae bacterium]|nr:TIGR04100 family radical SAM protein [Lachnospiraceae bacterium]